jgi:hypothetical protein
MAKLTGRSPISSGCHRRTHQRDNRKNFGAFVRVMLRHDLRDQFFAFTHRNSALPTG